MKFARTLQIHREGILNWYDHPISTGPLEGTNNKIKLLQRQTYSYRDLHFFKLKLLALYNLQHALGRVGIHARRIMVAAKCRKARKLRAVLS